MRRRLLTVASVLSLVLSLATVVLWVRSGNRHCDTVFTQWLADEPPPCIVLISADHCIVLIKGKDLGSTESFGYVEAPLLFVNVRALLADHEKGNFGWRYESGKFIVQLPDWFLAFVFVLLPAGAAIRALRRNHRDGLCPTCGYNLTGNTSGVCPECGTPITAQVPARRRGE